MHDKLWATPRILVPRSVVHRQPLLLLLIVASSGIVIDWWLRPAISWWLGGGIGLAVIFLAGSGRPRWRGLMTTVTVLTLLPLFGLWHHVRLARYEAASILAIAADDPRPAIIEGVIDRPLSLRRHPMADQRMHRGQSPWQTQIEIQLSRIRGGDGWRAVNGRAVVIVSGQQATLSAADRVRVYGQMQRFVAPSNPGEQDFRDVYRRRQLHVRVHVDRVDQIERLGQTRWTPARLIGQISQQARQRLLRYTGQQTGPLAIALVLGQREFVDQDLQDQLLVTGTVHLLSVSGLHLAIIVALAHALALVLKFPPTLRLIWILAICLFYTALTGARPPVVRAAVLVTIWLLAYWIRRPSQPLNTLSLAALLILVWNPFLAFGIGVQLSFLAVATLLLCHHRPLPGSALIAQELQQERRLQSLVEKSRSRSVQLLRYVGGRVGRAIWYSGCVAAITMPLVWHQFHVVSPISVVTNVLLGPLLFVALATGVATVVVGAIPPLGVVFGTGCDLALTAMRGLIDLAAAVPGGHVWLPAPPAWWIITFYLVVLATLYLPRGSPASWTRYGWMGGWSLAAWLLATTPAALPDGSIEATFVNVGHGTCAVLRSGDRSGEGDEVWLYDCGRLGNDAGRSRDIDAVLWSLGVTHLDGIYLSHADADHFNALPGLLRRFRVAQIVTPPRMLSDLEPAVVQVREEIDRGRVPVREVAAGERESLGGLSVFVLHPPPVRLPGSDNANSLVLRIDCGGTSLILPGDLEPPGTAVLIQFPRPPPGGVLMAPHHGSLRMDAASVLDWARPRQTIVSGGWRARRPEVEQMLSTRGSAVHVTSEVGAIRTRIDRSGRIEVRSWLRQPW
jgi:competence protein ComEC